MQAPSALAGEAVPPWPPGPEATVQLHETAKVA